MTRTELNDILVRIETGLPFNARKLLPLLTEIADSGGLDSVKDASYEQGYESGYDDGLENGQFEDEED